MPRGSPGTAPRGGHAAPRAGHPWVPQQPAPGMEPQTVSDGAGTGSARLVPAWGLGRGDKGQPRAPWHSAGTLPGDRSDSQRCHHPLPGDMGVPTQQWQPSMAQGSSPGAAACCTPLGTSNSPGDIQQPWEHHLTAWGTSSNSPGDIQQPWGQDPTALGTRPNSIGDITQQPWGHNLTALGTSNKPWGHYLTALGTSSNSPGDILQPWGYHPTALGTFYSPGDII